MPRANLTHRSVVAAGAKLADRDGLAAVTISALARQLGVQPASLYEHVRGVDGLLDGIQRLALDELASRIGEAVAGRAGADALHGLADAHRRYALERPGAWAALQRRASNETARSPEAARVSTLILAVVRGYPVPADDGVHAVRLVGATLNGFLALAESRAFTHRTDAEDASWTAAIDAIDRALSTWPQAVGA